MHSVLAVKLLITDFLRFQAIINKLWSELINTDYCGKGRPIILRKDLGSSRRGSRVGLFSGFRVGFLQVPVFLSTGWLFFWAFHIFQRVQPKFVSA